MKPFLFYLFILLLSTPSFSQKGKDGNLVVSSQIQINTYTFLTDDARTGDNYIQEPSGALDLTWKKSELVKLKNTEQMNML